MAMKTLCLSSADPSSPKAHICGSQPTYVANKEARLSSAYPSSITTLCEPPADQVSTKYHIHGPQRTPIATTASLVGLSLQSQHISWSKSTTVAKITEYHSDHKKPLKATFVVLSLPMYPLYHQSISIAITTQHSACPQPGQKAHFCGPKPTYVANKANSWSSAFL